MDNSHEEYESLRGNIDRQGVVAFAQHRNALAGSPASRLIHLTAVGELAALYADAFYRDDDDYMRKRYRRQVCEAAGFLHEVMLGGCDYEAVLDVADEAVARVVAAVTPDVRLPAPKRFLMLGNQVGLATVDAQMVKLADVRHQCSLLAAAPPEASSKSWLCEASEVLSCLHKLRGTPMEARVQATKRELSELEKRARAIRRR